MGVLQELEALKKAKADIDAQIKAATEAAKQELANIDAKRVKFATEIHKQIKAMKLDAEIAELGGLGFTYRLDGSKDANGVPETFKAVSLVTKATRTSKGSGRAGKTTSEYKFADGSNDSPSLNDVFEAFATDEDRAKMIQAETQPNKGSATYAVKVAVKKRALAEGQLIGK